MHPYVYLVTNVSLVYLVSNASLNILMHKTWLTRMVKRLYALCGRASFTDDHVMSDVSNYSTIIHVNVHQESSQNERNHRPCASGVRYTVVEVYFVWQQTDLMIPYTFTLAKYSKYKRVKTWLRMSLFMIFLADTYIKRQMYMFSNYVNFYYSSK